LGSVIDWDGLGVLNVLVVEMESSIFFIPLDAKISVFFELRRLDIPGSAQNIEPQ
jgi:hypothetical protein